MFSVSESKVGFLSNGLTIADLSDEGNFPADRQRLTMKVMTVSKDRRTLARKRDGRGSFWHEALDEFLIILSISSSVAGVKVVNFTTEGVSSLSTLNDIGEVFSLRMSRL